MLTMNKWINKSQVNFNLCSGNPALHMVSEQFKVLKAKMEPELPVAMLTSTGGFKGLELLPVS